MELFLLHFHHSFGHVDMSCEALFLSFLPTQIDDVESGQSGDFMYLVLPGSELTGVWI